MVRRSVKFDDKPVRLTPAEYRILEALAKQQGKVLTYSELTEAIKGTPEKMGAHYIQLLIGNIRQKIGNDTVNSQYIVTEHGIGYRLANQEIPVKNQYF